MIEDVYTSYVSFGHVLRRNLMTENVYRLASPKANVKIYIGGKVVDAAVAVFGYTPIAFGTGSSNPNGRFEALLRNWTSVWDRVEMPAHIVIGNRDADTGKVTVPIGAPVIQSNGSKFFLDDNWDGQKILGHVQSQQPDGTFVVGK
jgi:hypothetical protein